ncbi:NADH:ubiquinone reductase (Na(+)-transporting) subunit B [Marinilongibacter aquaticus]|uniref:NADH:ubiquinone reductase (Na(+)-transporting) subunit B n=1 Tax=Marinilongibacter aquaticus TaxID=2975157 RepID=UPI0021BDCEE2|nr:NADH:ubiquinone reductase (Na(+)-transporting) subunit B [Marinilongibacter aquaticus]UBM57956.1 NADH:ubiquinone reductase (Na(+)-transporting) subunit B [Marinilongibacter aquaticus]
MKFLQKTINNLKPNFEKGGKFEKWHPAFEAFETLLFVPGETTKNGVHIRDAMDLKRTMITVIIALVPCLLFGMWNVGFQHYKAFGMTSTLLENFTFGAIKVLPIVVVSYAAGLGVEFIFSVIKGHPISEGYLVTGLLIPLTLPVTVPLWMVALGAVFCTLLGKEIFGGTGFNFMNPALLARAFLFFAYPAYMSGEVWVDMSPEQGHAVVDAFSGATNLVAFDSNFHHIQAVSDLFWGFEQGSIGETSVFACLLGAFLLIVSGVGSWRIIVSVFAGAYLMGLLMNVLAPADNLNHAMHMPALNHLLIGGFAFGAIFMATDPVTAAHTQKGKIIYGLLIGSFTVLLRVFNPAYPEGMMLSILLFNVFAPLIDHVVVEQHIKSRMKHA